MPALVLIPTSTTRPSLRAGLLDQVRGTNLIPRTADVVTGIPEGYAREKLEVSLRAQATCLREDRVPEAKYPRMGVGEKARLAGQADAWHRDCSEPPYEIPPISVSIKELRKLIYYYELFCVY